MSDQPGNLILEHLRALRDQIRRVELGIDGLRADMVEVKERLGLLEGQGSSLSRRTDRIAGDVEQIKRRLEIVPAE